MTMASRPVFVQILCRQQLILQRKSEQLIVPQMAGHAKILQVLCSSSEMIVSWALVESAWFFISRFFAENVPDQGQSHPLAEEPAWQ